MTSRVVIDEGRYVFVLVEGGQLGGSLPTAKMAIEARYSGVYAR